MKHRILIIDDNDFSVQYLEGLIGEVYRIEHSPDGEQGVASALADPPDLILMDVEMPGIDGYEACRRLKQAAETGNVPVIFLSARVEAADRLAGYEAGGDDYITKPFDASELSIKIEVVLRNRQRNIELALQLQDVTSTALNAMSSAGDSGVITRFLGELVGCLDLDAVADCVMTAMGNFGLDTSLQLRDGDDKVSRSCQGVCSPLEESVLDNMSTCGRIVDLGSRSAFNFPRVSIIVKAMPVSNREHYGRIKDNLAAVVESVDLHLQTLQRVRSALRRGDTLLALLQRSMDKLREIENNYRVQRANSSRILNSLVDEIERSFITMGLTEDQELRLQDLVRDAIGQAQSLYDAEIEVDDTMRELTRDLDQTLKAEVDQLSRPEPPKPAQSQDSVELF